MAKLAGLKSFQSTDMDTRMIPKMESAPRLIANSSGVQITEHGAREIFFPLFDDALAAGSGFTCVGGRLHSGIEHLDSEAAGLECLTGLGEHCFSAWQEKRGDRIGSSEFLDNGADVFNDVALKLFAGESDRLFNCGDAFPKLEIGPGLMAVIGAPPGRGKTALAMQVVFDAIANEEGLQAVVASLEVTAATLVKRRIATMMGVNFDAIRFNTLTGYQRKEVAKQSDFKELLKRVGFLKQDRAGLGDLESLLSSREKPGLLLMDYVQLFGPTDANAIDRGMQTMKTARRFCEAGWGVIAVSAVNRSSYAKGDIGSFRDTSSIEYSGTSAYMLDEVDEYSSDEAKPPIRDMRLQCLKNRNGQPRSIDLCFNGPQMMFSPRLPSNPCEGDFDAYNNGDDPPWTAGE